MYGKSSNLTWCRLSDDLWANQKAETLRHCPLCLSLQHSLSFTLMCASLCVCVCSLLCLVEGSAVCFSFSTTPSSSSLQPLPLCARLSTFTLSTPLSLSSYLSLSLSPNRICWTLSPSGTKRWYHGRQPYRRGKWPPSHVLLSHCQGLKLGFDSSLWLPFGPAPASVTAVSHYHSHWYQYQLLQPQP